MGLEVAKTSITEVRATNEDGPRSRALDIDVDKSHCQYRILPHADSVL